MLRLALINLTFIFSFTACSLYESSGRQAIEKNQNNIIPATIFATGIDTKLSQYFICTHSRSEPDFLKEPLEIINTRYESKNISVLMNTQQEPYWIVAYSHNTDESEYDSCKVYFLNTAKTYSTLRASPLPTSQAIAQATRLGIKQIHLHQR